MYGENNIMFNITFDNKWYMVQNTYVSPNFLPILTTSFLMFACARMCAHTCVCDCMYISIIGKMLTNFFYLMVQIYKQMLNQLEIKNKNKLTIHNRFPNTLSHPPVVLVSLWVSEFPPLVLPPAECTGHLWAWVDSREAPPVCEPVIQTLPTVDASQRSQPPVDWWCHQDGGHQLTVQLAPPGEYQWRLPVVIWNCCSKLAIKLAENCLLRYT